MRNANERADRAPGNRRGQGVAELVLALPLLLLFALGIFEVARMIETAHVMSSLTREGANVAARGTSLEEAASVTRSHQDAAGLGAEGGVVASRIVVEDDEPLVVEQVAVGVPVFATRVGLLDEVATPYLDADLREGQSYYVIELFVPYHAVTPLSRLFAGLEVEDLYDRSLF